MENKWPKKRENSLHRNRMNNVPCQAISFPIPLSLKPVMPISCYSRIPILLLKAGEEKMRRGRSSSLSFDANLPQAKASSEFICLTIIIMDLSISWDCYFFFSI